MMQFECCAAQQVVLSCGAYVLRSYSSSWLFCVSGGGAKRDAGKIAPHHDFIILLSEYSYKPRASVLCTAVHSAWTQERVGMHSPVCMDPRTPSIEDDHLLSLGIKRRSTSPPPLVPPSYYSLVLNNMYLLASSKTNRRVQIKMPSPHPRLATDRCRASTDITTAFA